MTEGLGTNTVVQVGIVVRDIEKSLDAYCATFGIKDRPAVSLTDPVEIAQTVYHGQSTTAQARLAFLPMGQVTIELIEPVGAPSTWQEYLDRHGEGVHHIAFNVQGTPRVVEFLEQQAMPVAQQGQYTGGMYTYIESAARLGTMLELLENF